MAGAVVGIVAEIQWRAASTPYQVCHDFASLNDLAQQASGGALSPGAPNCSSVDHRFFLAFGVMVAGALLALVAVVAMYRRAWRSRRAGYPWSTPQDRLAVWIDQRLPRRRTGAAPRISGRVVAAASVTLILVAVSLALTGWDTLAKAREADAHHRGQLALASLQMPVELNVEANSICHPSPDTLCASSALRPSQVEPLLGQLLHGKPDPRICALLPTMGDQPCAIYGTVGGYRAMAEAFDHMVVVHDGKPPAGGVPVRPGSTRAYYVGSNITISLLTPTGE
jgi:hypothetical protein